VCAGGSGRGAAATGGAARRLTGAGGLGGSTRTGSADGGTTAGAGPLTEGVAGGCGCAAEESAVRASVPRIIAFLASYSACVRRPARKPRSRAAICSACRLRLQPAPPAAATSTAAIHHPAARLISMLHGLERGPRAALEYDVGVGAGLVGEVHLVARVDPGPPVQVGDFEGLTR